MLHWHPCGPQDTWCKWTQRALLQQSWEGFSPPGLLQCFLCFHCSLHSNTCVQLIWRHCSTCLQLTRSVSMHQHLSARRVKIAVLRHRISLTWVKTPGTKAGLSLADRNRPGASTLKLQPSMTRSWVVSAAGAPVCHRLSVSVWAPNKVKQGPKHQMLASCRQLFC